LHEDRVNSEVSRVSTVPEVRNVLVQRMRDYANKHDLVVEAVTLARWFFRIRPISFYIDASRKSRPAARAKDIARKSRGAIKPILARGFP